MTFIFLNCGYFYIRYDLWGWGGEFKSKRLKLNGKILAIIAGLLDEHFHRTFFGSWLFTSHSNDRET